MISQLSFIRAQSGLCVRPQTLLKTRQSSKRDKRSQILRIDEFRKLSRRKGERVVLNVELRFLTGVCLEDLLLVAFSKGFDFAMYLFVVGADFCRW